MTETLYKVTGPNGESFHGGSGAWDLPKDGKPGKWRTVRGGEIIACERGLHLCRANDLVYWFGPTIWEAEAAGPDRIEVNGDDGKVVVRKARLVRRLDNWNERTMRLFAVDCVERALPIYERERPHDLRPRRALEVARRLANGESNDRELAAARAAAWVAARDAARDAAWAAARVAARDAARAAAWAAARDAAWAAAWAAERQWQQQRLIEIIGLQA